MTGGDPPTRSPLLWRWFAGYARRHVARHFNAVRVHRAGLPPRCAHRPIVLYANHPAWWDPMLAIVTAALRYPDRRHFAPIDAAMLQRYRFFGKLGFFGVEADAPAGARAFLRNAAAVLDQPDACLWITAQGHFADPRQRPIDLRPGVAHLARRHPHAAFVPVAVEYPFWSEKRPETLVHFGAPIHPDAQPAPLNHWHARLTDALAETMDQLAADAIARDPDAFAILLAGRGGVSFAYDAWRWMRAKLTGRRFNPRHMEGPADAR